MEKKGEGIMEEIQYELELPEELYEQLCDLAEHNGITVEEQISRCCQAVIDLSLIHISEPTRP